MGDLEFKPVFDDSLAKANLTGKCIIYTGDIFDKQVYLFMDNNCTLMVPSDLQPPFEEKCCMNDSGAVKIVGNKNKIFFLSSEGNLYKLLFFFKQNSFYLSMKSLLKINWKKLDELKFTKILAITDTSEGRFVCLGIDKDGKKQLKMFRDVDNFEEYAFDDLNATPSNDYYLKAVETPADSISVIISDRLTGRTYLCQDNDKSSLIYCTQLKLISVISITAQNCFLLCFENGKIFIHFFSQSHSNCVLFLNKRIVCIEKCSCKEGCLLWSDGAILHHTEINFEEDGIKIRHFKIRNNIAGIISFVRHKNSILATTINNIHYNISINQMEKKELVQTPEEIISKIYKESLNIKDLQKNIQSVFHYAHCKQMIQNNQVCVNLNSEGNFLILKNMSKMTLEKQFWKIELRVSNQGCEQVKVIELDMDIVDGMIYKFENPFTKNRSVRVYLVGTFECETLGIWIGQVGKDDELQQKKDFKHKLNNIRLLYNPKI